MFWAYALPIVLLPNTLHLPADVGMATSLALLAWATIFGSRDPPGFPRTSYLLPPLTGLFLALLLGYVIAQWHDASTAGADLVQAKYAIIYPLLYLAYRHCGLDPGATRNLIVLALVVAAAAGLEAVFQGLQFDLHEFSDQQRATGPFGEVTAANRAGVFFAMFLPMLAALALQPGCRRTVRLLALSGSLILVAAILFTFSRQSYLIAVLGILLLLIHRGVPKAVLALVLIAGAGAVLLPESALQRMEETRQVGMGGAQAFDGSTASRLELWRGSLAMLADHPAGVGLGRFGDHIGEYTGFPGKDAHNSFVLMLAECGPFGLAMMLWLLWRLLALTRRLRLTARSVASPEAHALAVGSTVTVVCMAAGNLFGSPFFSALVMNSFWVLCGLVERYGTALAYAAKPRAADSRPAHLTGIETRFPLAARALPGFRTGHHARSRE